MEFYAMNGTLGSDYGDPCMSAMPSYLRFSHGTATMDFATGATRHVVLGDVMGMYADDSQGLECGPDSGVNFSSADGRWWLSVDPTPNGSSSPGTVWITYEDTDASYFAGRSEGCVAMLTEADAKGILGTASCTKATWLDDEDQTPAPSASFGGTFDAMITFEARP